MPEINFYLKSKKQTNKKGLVPIIAQISFNYKKYRKTIEKTNKKYWNKSKQRVRPNKMYEEYNRHAEINSLLDDYTKKTRDFFNECLKQGIEINADIIKGYLTGRTILKKKNVPFFEAFDLFIEAKKPERAHRTIMGYNTVKRFLEDFQNDYNYQITFQNIDLTFFDLLKKYALEYRKTKDNYFAKIVAVLKNFMRWTQYRDYHTNTTYQRFSFAEKDIDIIFLTIDELMHLYKFNFEHSRHRKARDIYCFGCFTGLRYSDLKQLKHDHIKDNTIKKNIQKTQQKLTIPLNEYALKTLDKYKDLPVYALPRLSGQKANKYIKEACKIAEINTPTAITERRGGLVNEITLPKYKLITMQTSRKTFATNSLILGMTEKAIKGITGHKKDATFNKYIEIADEYKKTQMENTWDKIGEKSNDN